jgi:hypothetical protein
MGSIVLILSWGRGNPILGFKAIKLYFFNIN